MHGLPSPITPRFLASIQPIVLVGGQSTRFGRDKLREPVDDAGVWMVQRPVQALRTIFGNRVKIVGGCHPDIARLADGSIRDEHPGAGPIAGVVSALRAWEGPVFVLAGDMPAFDAACVRAVVSAAAAHPLAAAVVAADHRPHPCAALYTSAALAPLETMMAANNRRLVDALSLMQTHRVALPTHSLHNVNRPSDLGPAP